MQQNRGSNLVSANSSLGVPLMPEKDMIFSNNILIVNNNHPQALDGNRGT